MNQSQIIKEAYIKIIGKYTAELNTLEEEYKEIQIDKVIAKIEYEFNNKTLDDFKKMKKLNLDIDNEGTDKEEEIKRKINNASFGNGYR